MLPGETIRRSLLKPRLPCSRGLPLVPLGFLDSSSMGNTHTYVCMKCDPLPDGSRPSWSTTKALESHQRSKHKVLSDMRFYVEADGVCPVRNTKFNSRIRCLAHLSDRRRTKCSDVIARGQVRRLADALVHTLDLHHRQQRRNAQQQGHTHPIAQKPATRRDGRVVGRLSM